MKIQDRQVFAENEDGVYFARGHLDESGAKSAMTRYCHEMGMELEEVVGGGVSRRYIYGRVVPNTRGCKLNGWRYEFIPSEKGRGAFPVTRIEEC